MFSNSIIKLPELIEEQNKVIRKGWENGIYNNIFDYSNDINQDEKIINSFSKNLIYVGASTKGIKRFWLRTKTRLRNPDFVVLNDISFLENIQDWAKIQDLVSKMHIKKEINVKKVVEFNGFYWHSMRFDGRTLEEYENDMIHDYKTVGIDCLVVWNFQLQKSLDTQRKRILDFIK